MRAIILVAGRGSRLPKKLSSNPKSFLKIGNKTIIEKLIKNFHELGINKIALVTGYKRYKFKKFSLKIFHNKKWKKTNMVYSLNKANSWLKKYKVSNKIINSNQLTYKVNKMLKNKNSHKYLETKIR